MLDLNRTRHTLVRERSVATGQTVGQEGLALHGLLEDGVEVCQVTSGSSDAFIGFSINTNVTLTTTTVVEEVTVPSSSPYTVTLRFGTLVATQIFATNTSESQDLTEGNPAVDNQYSVNDTTGIMTFHSGEAGDTVYVAYERTLTAVEAVQQFYEGHVNNEAAATFGQVGMIYGACEVYTDQVDISVDWFSATAVHTIASGQFANIGGTAITGARIIHVPSVDVPYLGLAVSIG